MKFWTQKQIATLVLKVNQGVPPAGIRIKNKNHEQIRHKLELLRMKGVVSVKFFNRWTEHETVLLVEGLKQGLPLEKIEIPGRNYGSKYSRLKLLRKRGLKMPLRGSWTDEEDKELLEQIQAGKRPIQIRINGRSMEAVRKEIARLHKLGKLKIFFRKKGMKALWTKEEVRILRSAYRPKGDTWPTPAAIEQSGALPGRTARAIQSKLVKLKLYKINPILSERIRQGAHPTPEEYQELQSFLQGEGRHWPNMLVAHKFGYKPDMVQRWRNKWGLKLVHAEALKDPLYKAWSENALHRRIRSRMLRRYLEPTKTTEQLYSQFRSDTIGHRPGLFHKCRTCHKTWYFSKEYFHKVDSKLVDHCLACLAPKK